MAEKMKGCVVGREGKEAEVDGGYFGGYEIKAADVALQPTTVEATV